MAFTANLIKKGVQSSARKIILYGPPKMGKSTLAASAKNTLIRQLSDAKIKPVIEIMKPANLKAYASLCGRVLARAHARSGDPVVLSSYMGKSNAFEDALAKFGVAYAEQNERDHACLIDAIRSGRSEATQTE